MIRTDFIDALYLDEVAITVFNLAFEVTGVCVTDFVSELVLGWNIWVHWFVRFVRCWVGRGGVGWSGVRWTS